MPSAIRSGWTGGPGSTPEGSVFGQKPRQLRSRAAEQRLHAASGEAQPHVRDLCLRVTLLEVQAQDVAVARWLLDARGQLVQRRGQAAGAAAVAQHFEGPGRGAGQRRQLLATAIRTRVARSAVVD